MLTALLRGTVLGITVCFLVGPAFFSLLQTSIHRGLKQGFLLSIGIVLSDMTLIALSFLGVLQVIDNKSNQLAIGIIGGIILIIFGIVTITRKVYMGENEENAEKLEEIKSPKPSNPFMYILKGYFLNIVNPFLLIFWVGAMSGVSALYKSNTHEIIYFFIGTLVTIFATDILKCFVADKISSYLKPKILLWVNRVMGLALLISGIVLIVRAVYYF
ncbi:MAG: LysE family transporter [Bacteroidetes bacterium]|nr:LysE family transporter [Bacteroidota bacterium]